MTRLGVFWNFLATRLIRKVAQVFGDFIDIYENDCFLSHTGVPLLFGQLFENLELLFIPSSGHTDGRRRLF